MCSSNKTAFLSGKLFEKKFQPALKQLISPNKPNGSPECFVPYTFTFL